MSHKAWAVRATSYLEGTNIQYAQTEITCHTRVEARNIMAAQKVLAKHAILRTEIEMFQIKVVPFDDDRHTIFYTRKR